MAFALLSQDRARLTDTCCWTRFDTFLPAKGLLQHWSVPVRQQLRLGPLRHLHPLRPPHRLCRPLASERSSRVPLPRLCRLGHDRDRVLDFGGEFVVYACAGRVFQVWKSRSGPTCGWSGVPADSLHLLWQGASGLFRFCQRTIDRLAGKRTGADGEASETRSTSSGSSSPLCSS